MENENSETRISRITIGRLHNLGDYEHIRYEIAVDIGANDNPSNVLQSLENILSDLQAKSGVGEYELRRAQSVLIKPASELDEMETRNLETYKTYVERHEKAIQRRAKEKTALSNLGGTSIYKDAKENWDDEDRW
jgi:hypothetical protein